MRMLWITFLLIGSISCAPQLGGGQPMWVYSASPAGQAQGPPDYEKPVRQASGYVGYSSYPEQSSGSTGYDSTSTAGSGSPYLVQQGVPQFGQHGAPGSGALQQTEESWSSSSDTSGEDEPVFTPVEDEDQVYAFKSRSRYNRKRLLFDQFRYTPTELHLNEQVHHHKDQVKGY